MDKFTASDKKITELIQSCCHLTREEWKKTVRPGDVIIPCPTMSKVFLHFRAIAKINQFIQASPFTSCKMIGRNEQVIGYSAALNVIGMCTVSFDTFLEDHDISLILRHKTASRDRLERAADLMYGHLKNKTPYDGCNLAVSAMYHWFGTKDVEKKDEAFMQDAERALICSTSVYKCYKEAGIAIEHPADIGAAWLWPKDILFSDSMQVIGAHFAADEQEGS